jgi:GT2 family glycosyltransferase
MLRRWPVLRGLLFGQFSPYAPRSYRAWVRRHDTLGAADRAAIAARVSAMTPRPISLLLALTGEDDLSLLADAAASVRGQLYPHWDLCIAGPSRAAAAARRLAGADDGGRIRLEPDASADDLLARARGAFVTLLPADARLPPQALFECAAALAARPEAELLYCDEDRLDAHGRRRAPLFKTGWSPDLLRGQDMLGDLVLVRREALLRAGGIGDPAARHDRSLRLCDAIAADHICHIPAILVHRCAPDGFASADADAVARHLRRSGVAGARVIAHPHLPGALRVIRSLSRPAPLVSVIVPTRDRAELLARCAAGVLGRTDYQPLEFIIADNGSTEPQTASLFAQLQADARVRVLSLPGPFNYARLNNAAAATAAGEILLLLNNDIDVIGPDWLSELVAHAVRPEVGAAGARLLYADGRMQHGGVALGVSGVAGHVELLAARDAPGYAGRLMLTRDVAAVTGACLAIRRSVYVAVGGLDADNLAVAYNDVDLCLRLRERGLRVIWTPFAELYHLESASRPFDLAPAQLERYRREIAWMRRRWGAALLSDPFYGANFALRDGHCFLAAPRRRRPWREVAASPPGVASATAAALAGS